MSESINVPSVTPNMPALAANLSMSRMSDNETVRIHVRIGQELLDVDLTLVNFALALTGRGDTPALVVRHLLVRH